ncbi:hypothetical protein [Streptomyces sp. NPDC048248]|uniref:hypothetical protein n=1 Tax=Streptomyces sp. NPDC048248 TaxID=3365523 RepID=UPI003710E75A
MRVAVGSAGVIGSRLSRRLAPAGGDVHFRPGGAHLEAVRRAGPATESRAGGVRVTALRAMGDSAQFGSVDDRLTDLKAWHIARALQAPTRSMALLGVESNVPAPVNSFRHEVLSVREARGGTNAHQCKGN